MKRGTRVRVRARPRACVATDAPARSCAQGCHQVGFLIIGAQKSGTTSLFRYLSVHPETYSPTTKELNFFNCEDRFAKGASFYHSHFPQLMSTVTDALRPVAFEATPDYLLSPEAPERIRAYHPQMRMIALLREPTERAYSAWNMYRRFFRHDPLWFTEWMCRCSRRRLESMKPRARFGESFVADALEEIEALRRGDFVQMPILSRGFYAKHLRRYLDHFPRRQLLVVRSEDLRSNSISTLGNVEQFLELSPHNWNTQTLKNWGTRRYDAPLSEADRQVIDEFYAPSLDELEGVVGPNFVWGGRSSARDS